MCPFQLLGDAPTRFVRQSCYPDGYERDGVEISRESVRPHAESGGGGGLVHAYSWYGLFNTYLNISNSYQVPSLHISSGAESVKSYIVYNVFNF